MNKLMLGFAALLAIIWAPASWAKNYSSLYVFGDSLVDAGNAYLGTAGVQANPNNGYFMGRFSNGPNFADDLSEALLGQPLTVPALEGGTNIAVGGTTAQSMFPGDLSFLEQAAIFPQFTGSATIPSTALTLVTFGGNDVRDTDTIPGQVSFQQASTDFTDALDLLYADGARNFVITGVPDIGLLPDSIIKTGDKQAQLALLTQRSQQLSQLFEADTTALNALPGVSATFFDLFDFEHDLIADPTAYGLPADLNTTTPCQVLGGGFPQLSNCTNSLYFDDIHPTSQVHQAIANAILAQLNTAAVPEPAAWMTMVLGFGAIGAAMRRRRRGSVAPVSDQSYLGG
jgi:phospholipase/lecithinase/hemolysin